MPVWLFLVFFGQAQVFPGQENRYVNEAEKLLEEFRRGAEFSGKAGQLASNGRADRRSISVLAEALRKEPANVREQVVKVLVQLGRETDPLSQSGGQLIRDKEIVKALVSDGLAKTDAARDIALQALQWSVPGGLLEEFGGSLTESLKAAPDETLLLVIAKAKPMWARAVIERLMQHPRWSRAEETRIAKAALGDTALEKEFNQAFLGAEEPREKARLAQVLGFIGTRAALSTLASEMRTPLVIEMPGVYFKSVRVDIVAALSYNYPELAFLWDNAIQDDSGYEKVERFCEETFGTSWKRSRPPYLTIQGLPSDIPA